MQNFQTHTIPPAANIFMRLWRFFRPGHVTQSTAHVTQSTAVVRPLRVIEVAAATMRSLVFTFGTILGRNERLTVDTGNLMNGHFVVVGPSGVGKSRLLLSLIEQARGQGAGVTLIDVAGDTAEDVLATLARNIVERGSTASLGNHHYFEPGNPLRSFRFDPFRYSPVTRAHPDFHENQYRAWLHATADRIGLLVQIKQGQIDFEQNARLQRVLTNVLIAVGTTVDRKGKHLPLSE